MPTTKQPLPTISKIDIYNQLKQVIDPELQVDIVSIGLIYGVKVKRLTHQSIALKHHSTQSSQPASSSPTSKSSGLSHSTAPAQQYQVYILMTLTSPGCPLIDVIESNIKSELDKIGGLNGYRDVEIELTFDPPWTIDMMDEAAKAELGF